MSNRNLGPLTSFLLAGLSVASFAAPAAAQTPAPAPAVEAVPPAPPPPPPPAPPPSLPPEPAVAVMPPPPPPPPPAAAPLANVVSKFGATLYGFAELDMIHDSTQSYAENAGNPVLARDGWTKDAATGTYKAVPSYAANNGRMMESIRNSRLGFKLKGPETENIKSSAIAEMDFLGNQPQGSPAPTGSPAVSESSFFTSPTFRVRHFALKMETPIIDVLAGQYWQLFGWQSYFHPNTVEMQGVPGQVYSRSPQLRLSHTFKTDAVNVEIAVAALRPVQRDAYVPDGQGGIKVNVNGVKGVHTTGAAGTAVDSLAVGVSGLVRRFDIPEFSTAPTGTNKTMGWGFSADALIPVIPAKTANDGGLTLTGSYVYGKADADMYTGLSGGASFATLPNPTMASPAPSYTANIDPGLVTYSSTGQLHSIDWRSFIVGLQYYLPPSGHVWLSANFSMLSSHNIDLYATGSMAGAVFKRSQWADGNIFVDLNPALRLGFEGAWFSQKYVDDSTRKNYRMQASAFYIF